MYMSSGSLERIGAHGGLLQDGRAAEGQVQVPPRARRRAARAARRQEGLQDAAAVARGALQPAPPAHRLWLVCHFIHYCKLSLVFFAMRK